MRANASLSACSSSKEGSTTILPSVHEAAGLAGDGLPGVPVLEGVGGAAHVAQVAYGLAGGEAACDLPDGALAHAEDQQVCLAVEQDRAAQLIHPVVVVRDAAQRGLDTAEHDRETRERLAAEVRVDDGGPVRTAVGLASRAVLVLAPHLLLCGELVQHRVEVARAHTDEQPRPAHARDVLGPLPVGLGDEAHLVTAALEEASDQHGTKRRVVDVGVPTDNQDVELVPAAGLHVLPTGRQKITTANGLPTVLGALQLDGGHGAGVWPLGPRFASPGGGRCRFL